MSVSTIIEDNIVFNKPGPESGDEDIFNYAVGNLENWSTLDVVWDLEHFDFHGMKSETVRLFAERAVGMAEWREGRKTAVIVKSELGFGMMRMLQIMGGDRFSFTLAVFRDRESALAWIRE